MACHREHRPVLLELPEAMDLYIDEELFGEGFPMERPNFSSSFGS